MLTNNSYHAITHLKLGVPFLSIVFLTDFVCSSEHSSYSWSLSFPGDSHGSHQVCSWDLHPTCSHSNWLRKIAQNNRTMIAQVLMYSSSHCSLITSMIAHDFKPYHHSNSFSLILSVSLHVYAYEVCVQMSILRIAMHICFFCALYCWCCILVLMAMCYHL